MTGSPATQQHDMDKSQDVTSSITKSNTRNRTWYDDSIQKRKRSSLSGECREHQGPTRRRTSWEGPGTRASHEDRRRVTGDGRRRETRQSKEAENAFINPRSWPGRRTAVDVADEVVMVCVGGGKTVRPGGACQEEPKKKKHRLVDPWWCEGKTVGHA